MSTAAIVILVIVLLAVLFAAGWFLGGRARSRRLRDRFGPEYDRSVEETEDRKVAERVLAAREKRHAQLELKPLSVADRTRYTERWTKVQERFVDEPAEAVVEADDVVHDVMRDRGYPTEGHEQEAADLSVEHAEVVSHYRSGHEIRGRHERGEADTEHLRQAMVHYRTVFHELVGEVGTTPATPGTPDTADTATDTTPAARPDVEVPVARETRDRTPRESRDSDHVRRDGTGDDTVPPQSGRDRANH